MFFNARVTTTANRIVLLCLLSVPAQAQEHWPRFRGPNGAGRSSQKNLPVKWSDSDYAWRVSIPGKGHSSPVVWGDRVFVTVSEDGRSRRLVCLDARTGKQLWTQSVSLDAPRVHQKNSWASGSPATDGERVYVVFAGNQGHTLAAFQVDGKPLWDVGLGTFRSQHGHGVSPIVFGDLVIVANDQQGPSSVSAFDRKTGKPVWQNKRIARRTSYATPFVYHGADKKPQLICVSGAMGVSSIDPHSGEMNWSSGALPKRTVASPVLSGGLIFACCGQGGGGVQLVGVDPKPNSKDRVSWSRTTILPYVPTPVSHDGFLFLWTDRGIVACVDPKTGQDVWKQRIGGNFSSSPVCIDGKLYCISEEGVVVVVEAGPEFRLLGKTPLDGRSYATPAVAGGRLFLRTFDELMCLTSKEN